MDTVAQVHGHLLAHQYEGLVKKVQAARGAGGVMRLIIPGAAGGREGTQAVRLVEKHRIPAALDRRHAARSGQGRHAGRAPGQGRDGSGATWCPTISSSASSPTASRSPMPSAASSSTVSPHGGAGRGARRHARAQGLKLDAVIEFKVDESALLSTDREAGRRNDGRRRRGPHGRQSGRVQDPARSLPQADGAACRSYYRATGDLRTVDGMKPIDEVTVGDRRNSRGGRDLNGACPRRLRQVCRGACVMTRVDGARGNL